MISHQCEAENGGAGAVTDSIGETPNAARIAIVEQFVGALFEPDDLILVRPFESWLEGARKNTRVDYKRTRWMQPRGIQYHLPGLLEAADEKFLNLCFGVCPRFGTSGKFDLAWQIRTVRSLWADIDHATPEDVLNRIQVGGLPAPSIVVSSGHGAHVYWLLDEPYLIDDADDPPPVEKEWIKQPNDKSKPRNYIVEDGERVYLDKERPGERLSEKANYVQDLMAGISATIGGDNTSDLARMLRLPGTLNRKNQRNGDEPVEAELIECDANRRFSLKEFERFKGESAESKRKKQIAAVPLPRTRKNLSPTKADKIDDRIAICAMAEPGQRSEADFALCCLAVESGMPREELWSRVQGIGKFAEKDERYFDRTWSRAEDRVRSDRCDKLQSQLPSGNGKATHKTTPADDLDDHADDFLRHIEGADEDDDEGCITIRNGTPVATTLSEITTQLCSTGEYYSRSEQLVHIRDEVVTPVLSSNELAGHVSTIAEVSYIGDDGTRKYRPLKPEYANCWLNNHVERSRLKPIDLFTRAPCYSPEEYRLLAPGYDEATHIYYAGPIVEPREGTDHLDRLLRDFCFREAAASRTNYLAMLLTSVLMPSFVGAKPAWLFNGNQPGLGKSMLAQVGAILRDGKPTETITYNANDEEFEKRLGAAVRNGTTTLLIDNAKRSARSPRIESACLERSITDETLSFRLLGASAEIRAENSHIIAITANSPDVSRDLVSRCAIVNLYHEGNPERRRFSIADPEQFVRDHRIELLGELLGMVERWKASGKPLANVDTRFSKRGWGAIVGGVLQANNEPDFLANADEAAVALDETRREFAELVAVLARNPRGTWRALELAKQATKHRLLQDEIGDGSDHSKASKMGMIAGRYLEERFPLECGTLAYIERDEDRNGKFYRIGIDEND